MAGEILVCGNFGGFSFVAVECSCVGCEDGGLRVGEGDLCIGRNC